MATKNRTQLRVQQMTGSIADIVYSGSKTSAAAGTDVAIDLPHVGGILGELAGAIGRISGKTGTGTSAFTNQATGVFTTDVSPSADNTYDLGTTALAWKDLLMQGDVLMQDAGTVSTAAGNLTVDSLAGTLTLDGHTGVNIDASNSGKLALDGAGGIDIGVAADVAVDFDAAAFDLDASGAITIDGTSTFSIDGVGASNVTTNGALTLSGSTALNLQLIFPSS